MGDAAGDGVIASVWRVNREQSWRVQRDLFWSNSCARAVLDARCSYSSRRRPLKVTFARRNLVDVPFEQPSRQFRWRIQIALRQQHPLHVIVQQTHVRWTVDRMKPRRTPAEKDQEHICQRARSQAAGNRQVKPPADAAVFSLPLELVERECRKPLLRAAAAAAVTDEQVTVLNPNLLSQTIGSRNLPQRSMSE